MTSHHNGRVEFHGLLRPHLEDYCPASNLAFNEKVKRLMAEGQSVYHFGFGQAPFPVVEVMVEALRKHAGQNAYLPVAGIPELQAALCDFHAEYDQLTDLQPDQIIISPGTKELIYLLMNVFNGDVLLISPTWTTYKPQSELAHHKPHVIPTSFENNWRVTPQAIEKTIKDNKLKGNKLLVLCNPDNPTGTSYEEEHLKALSEVCRKNNIIVISDEIYARLHFKHNHKSLATYYPEGTVLSSGFSKWASAGGWRLGYHIYPRELTVLRDAVRSAASHTYSCAPAPIQYAMAEALVKKDAINDYIFHTNKILAAVAEYCHRELTSVGVECHPSAGGYYIFPNFEVLRGPLAARGITTCDQMCDVMFQEARVALMAGGPAFLRPHTEFTTRLCYVNFDGATCLTASRRLGRDGRLDDGFLTQYCGPMYDGIQAIKTWIQTQLKR